MDALIELIVWIFRAIGGDPEKPPENDRPSPRSPGKRGPYNYGDQATQTRRPKTLEEILEEVRREAAQKKGAAPPRPTQTTPPPKPFPQPAARVEDRTLRTSLEAGRPPEAPLRRTVPDDEEQVKLSSFDKAPAPAPKAQVERSAPKMMPEQLTPQEAAAALAATAATTQAVATVREVKSVASSPPAATLAPARALVNALRSATPQARRDAAWQSIVLAEIFGPPRSRRMNRRLI